MVGLVLIFSKIPSPKVICLLLIVFLLLQFPINKLTDLLRESVAAAGFTECLTFALVSTFVFISYCVILYSLVSGSIRLM